MSPSKSKLKEKKAGKDAQKVSLTVLGSVKENGGVPASAYDPHEGTFHTLDQLPTSSASAIQSNGRFRNIDESDVSGFDYDSASNTGSWSGDSEDHKDKTFTAGARNESIPGAENDKREKVRQKNERKHQRQKERRAQELHERCSGFLMSRKLEALAQQLMAMGISQEQATMALILNDGKVEESVTWLFDRKEEAEKQSFSNPGNLKIDISEELARITDMEIRYKCTKQEVERAVVAAEGNLDKAEETLRAQKQDLASRAEESSDPLTVNNCKPALGAASQNTAVRSLPKPAGSPALVQQKGDERNFNYMKTTSSIIGGLTESQNRTMQHVKRVQPKPEWGKPLQATMPAEKRLASTGSHPSSIPYSLSSPSPPLSKTETRYVALGKGFRDLQQPSLKEPITVMQKAQDASTKLVPATSVSSSPGTSWHPAASIEIMKSNGIVPHVPVSKSLSLNNLSSNRIYQQFQYQHQQHLPLGDLPGPSRGIGSWSRNAAPSPTYAASSLGLFAGLGSNGTSMDSSSVDWSMGGSIGPLDYTNIDWSVDRIVPSSRPSGLWLGTTLPLKSSLVYDSDTNGFGAKPSMRVAAHSNGVSDSAIGGAESATSSREWTSPFEGRDLFTLPRQFVSSPSH